MGPTLSPVPGRIRDEVGGGDVPGRADDDRSILKRVNNGAPLAVQDERLSSCENQIAPVLGLSQPNLPTDGRDLQASAGFDAVDPPSRHTYRLDVEHRLHNRTPIQAPSMRRIHAAPHCRARQSVVVSLEVSLK